MDDKLRVFDPDARAFVKAHKNEIVAFGRESNLGMAEAVHKYIELHMKPLVVATDEQTEVP